MVISKYRARVAALDEEIQRLEADDTGASAAPDTLGALQLSALPALCDPTGTGRLYVCLTM